MSAYFLGVGLLQPAFVFASLLGTTAFFRRRGLDPTLALGASFATVGIAALAVFWFTWWLLPGHNVATIATIVVVTGAIGCIGLAFSRKQWRDETGPPIGLAFIATLGLLLWVHAGHDSTAPLAVAARRWTHALPPDNTIPLQFARAMGKGRLPVGQPSAYFGDWLSSDRPPLQTAMFLVTPGHLIWRNSEPAYQAAAVSFQLLALVAAWALARSIGASRGIALAAEVAVFFTPLGLVNGAYVWPKLLAAAFVLLAAAIHFSPTYCEIKRRTWCGPLVGSLACLAMLAHGASAFALIGVGVATLMLRRLGSARYLAGALVAFAVIFSPWAAYQRFVDPPGNRLLKWHLAGVVPVDSRGFWQTIEDSYASKTWNQLIADREANFGTVIDPGWPAIAGSFEAARDAASVNIRAASAALKPVRVTQFFHFIPGTGPLGFALYLLPVGLLDQRTRAIALTIILSLAAWMLLMFLPASTVIHQGSLFPEIALVIITIVFAAKRSVPLATALIAAQVAVTGFQYAL
jgi:hypothetical protein